MRRQLGLLAVEAPEIVEPVRVAILDGVGGLLLAQALLGRDSCAASLARGRDQHAEDVVSPAEGVCGAMGDDDHVPAVGQAASSIAWRIRSRSCSLMGTPSGAR